MITVNEATKNYLAKEEILCILDYFLRLDSQKWPYSHKEEEHSYSYFYLAVLSHMFPICENIAISFKISFCYEFECHGRKDVHQ